MRRRVQGGAGTNVRERIRGERSALLRLYVRPILTFTLVWSVAGVAVFQFQGTDFQRGFWVGLFVTGLAAMPFWVLAANGLMQKGMGADAEEWTAERLGKLDPRRWWAVHGLVFDRMDVDHVLVGSRHVFAIETKWCSYTAALDRRLPGAIRQAQIGARKTAALLRSKGAPRPVTPVVIVWGPGHRIGGATMTERDGVLVAVSAGVDDLLAELGRRCGSYELDLEPRRVLEAFAARQAEWRAVVRA